MSRAALTIALALLLAGCVGPDLVIRVETANATGNLTNATLVPAQLNLCVFGLPTAEDAALASSLSCRGQTVTLGVLPLNNTSPLERFPECAVFFLKDDAEGRYLDRALRMALRAELLAGKSLVLWGESGTLVHDDPAVAGWDPDLGDLVPARVHAPGRDAERLGSLVTDGSLDLVTADALLEGWRDLSFAGLEVTEGVPENGADISAHLRTGPYATSVSYLAILHRSPRSLEGALARSHAYWFAFDPQRHTPLQLRTLLASLAGNWLAFRQVTC
jgi:hypothetical protein